MKSTLPQLLLLSMLAAFNQPGLGQRPTGQKNYVQREATYHAIVQDMYTVRDPRMADTAHPTVTLKIAALYRENNILPTRGSVELLHKLNPDLDESKPIPANARILLPHFPPLTARQLETSKNMYNYLKMPNAGGNEKFVGLSSVYTQDIGLLETMPKYYSGGFRDTTEFLKNYIIPVIVDRAASTCLAQMNYFNSELDLINRLLDDILRKRSSIRDLAYSIEEMIEDLMRLTNLGLNGIPSTASKARKDPAPPGSAPAGKIKKDDQPKKMNSSGKSDYSGEIAGSIMAAWRAGVLASADVDWNNPVSTDIYVYKNAQQQDPVMAAYEFHYAPNGIIYSLNKPGCDTMSYFSSSKDNIASTLPLVLGKGKYCFLLKNIHTGEISLHEGIDLADLNTYDDQKRLIVPLYSDDN